MHNQENESSDARQNSETNPSTYWKIGIAIILFLICITGIKSFYKDYRKEEAAEDKKELEQQAQQRTGTEEALKLVSKQDVAPGLPWITPTIDYRFKFRTDGHAINLEFTSKNGGWTDPVKLPATGEFPDILPVDAVQGPVKVSTGKGETGTFFVQLYRKIYI